MYARVTFNKKRIGAAEIYRLDEGDTLWFLIEQVIKLLKSEYGNKFDYMLWKPGEIENPEAYFEPNTRLMLPRTYAIDTPSGQRFFFTWHEL